MSESNQAGVTPDRPNHERGCIYRYGVIPEDGFNCDCPHKDHPNWKGKCKGCKTPIPTDAEYCGDCYI